MRVARANLGRNRNVDVVAIYAPLLEEEKVDADKSTSSNKEEKDF